MIIELVDKLLKVLIVDDEASQRTGLSGMVKAWNMSAETASEGAEALEKVASFSPDVIVTDLNMPGMDGFQFLGKLRELGDAPPAIVLTAYGNVETGVRAIHELNAFYFLEKPIQPNVMQALLRLAASHNGLRQSNRILERQLLYKGSLGEMVGASARMKEIFVLLQQAGPTNACVLISGESGTGKELVARTLHALSPRNQGPFFAINCAALPETLIESELFGHEKGAFTGASERRAGCFELAQHGTLLLDEIGEMPLATQAKLLRVIEESKVRRLGGTSDIPISVRVLAATNRPPEKAIENKQLREDLYYRLNVFHVSLPPLRDRKQDIPALAAALIRDLNRKHGCRVTGLSEEVLERFQNNNWPGNVRELRNLVERAVIVAAEGEIQARHLPGAAAPAVVMLPSHPQTAPTIPDDVLQVRVGTRIADVEEAFVRLTLKHNNNNKRKSAEVLGLCLRTLHNKLRAWEGNGTHIAAAK
jgi:DNA-binding NtrC family response regulator